MAAMSTAEMMDTISAAASLSASMQNTTGNNVVIELTNHLDTPLFGGNHFLAKGWSLVPPPTVISKDTREAFQFAGSSADGVVSFSVALRSDPFSFAITFSKSSDFRGRHNYWFGLAIIDVGTEMNDEFFKASYKDPDRKNSDSNKGNRTKKFSYAKSGKALVIFHQDYIISANMSTAGQAILKVDILKRAGGFEENHHLFSG